MARPLRIEFAGGLYHVTSRGNARQDIYIEDPDRTAFLQLIDKTRTRFDWYVHAYCLMGNHYHLLIETATPTLAKGMKLINGCYTQFFNRKHRRVGHLFQGRYKAILVDKEDYLLELARYIVLNPVRVRMVRSAAQWEWSSYRATAGLTDSESLLTTDWILSCFADKKIPAQKRYRRFVQSGRNQPSPWDELKNQIYLGDDDFVEEAQCKLDPGQSLRDIPRKQKLSPPKPVEYFARKFTDRSEAMARAYLSQHYTLEEVGKAFGVSYATVSRALKRYEQERQM